MIDHLGPEKTETIIRGWVDDLATDIFSDNTALLEAIAAGQCEVGIANSYYYCCLLDEKPDFPVKLFWANQGSNRYAHKYLRCRCGRQLRQSRRRA